MLIIGGTIAVMAFSAGFIVGDIFGEPIIGQEE